MGKYKCVCLSCGNASAALAAQGLQVVDVSPSGTLMPNRWLSSAEIEGTFDCFNATSGYLNMELMESIGVAFKKYLGPLPSTVYVPCGSGETLVCLKLAYPSVNFVACYNNSNPATTFDAGAPLNNLVMILASEVVWQDHQK